MRIDLSEHISSVMNPNGRFRTLEGIYALRDEDGEPRMKISGTTADFETVYRNDKYTLRFLLEHDGDRIAKFREISAYTTRIDCPYLAPCLYLEKEMMVFNRRGEAEYSDVILQKNPGGIRLDACLSEVTERGDSGAVSNIIRALAGMARWLAESEFSHGNICSANIYITPSGIPVLVNYDKSSRSRSHDDIISLGALAAALYVTSCRPEIYAGVIHGKMISPAGVCALPAAIAEILNGEGGAELGGLLAVISHGAGFPEDTTREAACETACETICRAITKLGNTPPRSYASLDNLSPVTFREDGACGCNDRYGFIGEMHDMMMRVSDRGKWHYIDRHGNTVISGPFLSAEDFSEGRAVVGTGSGYGLIDTEGRFVIEPDFCDIEWNSHDNIAIVTFEGRSGLISREGVALTGLLYDHILGCSEGLLPFKLNGKFGYLRRDGTEAIGPVYDDAFCFRNGYARVKLANRDILIDHRGNRIDEAIGTTA